MNRFHLLVIRLSSMGDIILQTGLLAYLKQNYGDNIKITFLTSKEFVPLIDKLPEIDEVLSFSRKEEKLKDLFLKISQLDNIDLILDLHSTLRSLAIRFKFFTTPRLVVDKRRIERFIFTKLRINLLKDFTKSRAEFQLERIIRDFQGIFGAEYKREELSEFITNLKPSGDPCLSRLSRSSFLYKELKDNIFFKNLGLEEKKYICLFPSASFEGKRWPVESFINYIEMFIESFPHYKVLILAGPLDSFCHRFDFLVEKFAGKVFNLFKEVSLEDSCLLTKGALYCLGNDTGLLHVSESLGTPVITIFGPTSEDFGFYPHLLSSQTASIQLWCRPCSPTGKGKCIRKERLCLTNLQTQLVWSKTMALMGGK